jgi:hypothetical protein
MDDGARNRKSLYLNTQQFTINDQLKLLSFLDQQFGFRGNLNRDKSYFRIRLFQSSAQQFKKMVEPIIPKFMKYKLPL